MNTVQLEKGVYPTMLTPFSKDDRVLEQDVEKLLDFYGNAGVQGVFALCQSSEIFFLTQEEKVSLTKRIVHCQNGKKRILVSGNTEENPVLQIEQAKRLMAEGPDVYVLLTNRLDLHNEGDDVFKRNAEKFLNAMPDTAFGLYECPYPYKRALSDELLRWCADSGRFVFLKDTSCSCRTMEERVRITRDSNLKIFNANSATLFETLKFGVHGFSGIMSNFQPHLYVWLCEHYHDDSRAKTVGDFLGITSAIEGCSYPKIAKYALKLQNVFSEISSRCMDDEPLPEAVEKEIKQLLDLTEWMEAYLENR